MRALFLHYINLKGLFSIDQLNTRIRWLFSVLPMDKGDTPAELNQLKTLGGGISPKLTAVEMAALGRYMPVLLYSVVQFS